MIIDTAMDGLSLSIQNYFTIRYKQLSLVKYNMSFVYCRELAPETVSFTGVWARSDDSKQKRYYSVFFFYTEFRYSV